MTRILSFYFWATLTLSVAVIPVSAQGQAQATAAEIDIRFLSIDEAAVTMTGGEQDEFFKKLQPREVAAMTGVAIDGKSVAESQTFGRQFFQTAVLAFDDEETKLLRDTVRRLDRQFGERFPRIIRRPWRFLKSRNDLCGGFSWTRADCIVLSEATLAKLLDLTRKTSNLMGNRRAEALLLHEQMHVLQRADPGLFSTLYQEIFRFEPASVRVHPWVNDRQVTNPDATSDDWVVLVPSEQQVSQPYWLGTILRGDKNSYTMGRDFKGIAVQLQRIPDGDGYEMAVDATGHPIYKPLDQLDAFTARLPIRNGHDHPNEVAAYLFTAITHGQPGATTGRPGQEVLTKATAWFEEHFQTKEIP